MTVIQQEVNVRMKATVVRWVLGLALAGALPMSAVSAEGGSKTLPTLMIKGEVVSLDSNDPAATLLKVKDRYGFETPIYLTPETKVTQGEAAQPISSLSAGTPVEVEYNFDVNTAKRHAVSVKVASAAAAAAESAVEATPEAAAPAAAPAAEAAPEAMPEAPAAAVAPGESALPAADSAAPAPAAPASSGGPVDTATQ